MGMMVTQAGRRHKPSNYPSTTVQVFFCSFNKTSKCARCTNVQHYITWGLLTSPGYNHFLQLSRTCALGSGTHHTIHTWNVTMRFWSESTVRFHRKRLESQKSHFEVLIFLFHKNNELIIIYLRLSYLCRVEVGGGSCLSHLSLGARQGRPWTSRQLINWPFSWFNTA